MSLDPRRSASDPAPALLTIDERWPRAGHWLAAGPGEHRVDLAVLGVPTFTSSPGISGAHATPAAVRRALHHYTTWCESRRVDVGALWPWDAGDVQEPDLDDGDWRVQAALQTALAKSRLVVAVGGDGAATAPVVLGGYDVADMGLIVIDSQHDLRDGRGSLSGLRRILDAGLPAERLVHLGGADWATSMSYASELRAIGAEVVGRGAVEQAGPVAAVRAALDVASNRGSLRPIHVSVDLSVCDRAAAPACRDSVPGGLTARELLSMVFTAALDARVRAFDIVGVDANADADDQRTVRLVAMVILEIAAALTLRA